jgi:hypothetical protein
VRQCFIICVALVLLTLGGALPTHAAPGPTFRSTTESTKGFQRSMSAYKPYVGKTIRTVSIEILDVFDDPDLGALYQTANKLKINTREYVVRRELLLKEGEPFDAFYAYESERLLRELRFLREVYIVPTIDGDFVDITVRVQDTWTLLPQFGYSSGDGKKKQSVGISDKNLGGFGKRAEILFEENDQRASIETVYEDIRFLGTFHKLLLGYFDRSDGDRTVVSVGRPFRSLIDSASWDISTDTSRSVGRLYRGGTERYIFRQNITDLSSRYTISRGDPQRDLDRYAIGYDYLKARFFQADSDDYENVNLDPDLVSNDPAQLARDRLYTGPVLTYEHITPEFIKMNYIDRFDLVEDFNLGDRYSLNLQFAPKTFGSTTDAILVSGSKSKGYQFEDNSFIRLEAGINTRYEEDSARDLIARVESNYYNVLGPQYVQGTFFGKHTIAARFFLDYGRNLDKDREFQVGADNVLRGYEARSFTGDKRYGLNLEDRIHLAEDLFQLVSFGTAFFVDVGGATRNTLSDLIQNETYADVGFGLRFAFLRSSGGSIVRIDIAAPLRDGIDGSNAYEIRVLFSGGQLFSSRLRSESLGAEKANVAVGLDR